MRLSAVSATPATGSSTGLAAALTALLLFTALTVSVVIGFALGTDAAGAAPYPPTEPCTVWTARQGTTDDAGQASLTVFGSGLGPTEQVRLVHTASQRTVGYARTGSDGRFTATVSAPTGPEGQTPQISAASPESTCTTPPPGTSPSTPPSTSPGGNGTGGPGDGNGGNGGNGTGGSDGGGNTAPGTPGGSSSPNGPSPTSGGATQAPSSAPASGTTGTPGPRSQADPPRITDLPFTIGLVIAAVLLVLGTLLVLMIARRPDRR